LVPAPLLAAKFPVEVVCDQIEGGLVIEVRSLAGRAGQVLESFVAALTEVADDCEDGAYGLAKADASARGTGA
jgi:hypothetical protein